MADKSIRLTFDTQEASPELMSNIQNTFQKTCVLAVSGDNFTSEFLKEMENIKIDYDDRGKSQAYRIRSVLYLLWNQNKEGYEIFNDYYNCKTEMIIEKLKCQIVD